MLQIRLNLHILELCPFGMHLSTLHHDTAAATVLKSVVN